MWFCDRWNISLTKKPAATRSSCKVQDWSVSELLAELQTLLGSNEHPSRSSSVTHADMQSPRSARTFSQLSRRDRQLFET